MLLALDISGSTGWAAGERAPYDGKFVIGLQYGVVKLSQPAKAYALHPWGYWAAAADMAGKICALVDDKKPEIIVIEETNGGGRAARWSQKFLEYAHYATLQGLSEMGYQGRVIYVNSSEWRRVVGCHLTKDDKNRNAKLSRHKRKATKAGKTLDKKALGIRGKTTIKHVAIRLANELYGLDLKAKDDDVADAILLLTAYHNGASPCLGQEP